MLCQDIPSQDRVGSLIEDVVLRERFVGIKLGNGRSGDVERVQDHNDACDPTVRLRFLRKEITREWKIGFPSAALFKQAFACVRTETRQIIGELQRLGACTASK